MHPPTPEAIEREVRGNVLAQTFGAGTVADLGLPDEFLRRCTDRSIIASFNERYRRAGVDAADRPPPPPAPTCADSELVRCLPGLTTSCASSQDEPDETPAVLRGARYGVGSRTSDVLPPDDRAPYELRRAAKIVSASLARDGVAATAVAAAAALKPLLSGTASLPDLLGRSGLPTDIAAMFALGGAGGFARGLFLPWLEGRIRGGASTASLREALRAARFEYQPSLPGFRARDDAGDEAPTVIRLQLTRGDDWLGEGDGGSLDIARQLAHLFPTVAFAISAREDHAPLIARHAAQWSETSRRSAPITVIAEHATVSQWAQDNARAGCVERRGSNVPTALLPRYASRGEERSMLVPGDSSAAESLSLLGVETARSPLLFQGGNLVVVNDRKNGLRILLAGEGEVHRNVALGLTEHQVLLALCAEFGVDRAVTLPAASYHIDNEVMCITDPTTLDVLAFVSDSDRGAATIIEAGLSALREGGVIDRTVEARVLAATRGDHTEPCAVETLRMRLNEFLTTDGAFGGELSRHFTSGGRGESMGGNLLTFLAALDHVAARLQIFEHSNPHAVAAARAMARLQADRERLRGILADLGWRTALVPSFPAAERGVCALNGVRAGDRLLIPSNGGAYSALDLVALKALQSLCLPVQAELVRSAESQRRNGLLRCSIGLF